MKNDISNIIMALRNGDYDRAIWLCDYLRGNTGTPVELLALAQLSKISNDYKEGVDRAIRDMRNEHYNADMMYLDMEIAYIRAHYSIIVNTLMDSIVGEGRV